MIIKRRFPNFSTGFEETEHDVANNQELLAIDWIANYSEIPNYLGVFCSKNEYEDEPSYLMSLAWSESDKRVIYFVVGYIFGNPSELGLEDYNEFIKRYENERSNKTCSVRL